MALDCNPANPPPDVPGWFCQLTRRDECLPPRWRYLWPALAAIARKESGFKAWALRDETLGVDTKVRSVVEAVAYIRRYPSHVYGAGMMQHTGPNLVRWFGPQWHSHVFDACKSLRKGAEHFVTDNLPVAFERYNGTGPKARAYGLSAAGEVERITGALVNLPMTVSVRPERCGAKPQAWAAWRMAQYRACMREDG